jgi:hypothetical protein
MMRTKYERFWGVSQEGHFVHIHRTTYFFGGSDTIEYWLAKTNSGKNLYCKRCGMIPGPKDITLMKAYQVARKVTI